MDGVGDGLGVKDDTTSLNSKDFTIRKNKSRKDIESYINQGTSSGAGRKSITIGARNQDSACISLSRIQSRASNDNEAVGDFNIQG